jgi:hypothetical protein
MKILFWIKDGLRLPILRQKNYQKALFYVNKALTIDDQNQLYWEALRNDKQTIGLI